MDQIANKKINSPSPLDDKVNLVSFIISFLLNLAGWILPYLLIKPVPEPIILHYNIYFGVDLIGEWYRIFFLPASATILLLINIACGVLIYRKDATISRIFFGGAVIIQLLTLISTYLLTRINT